MSTLKAKSRFACKILLAGLLMVPALSGDSTGLAHPQPVTESSESGVLRGSTQNDGARSGARPGLPLASESNPAQTPDAKKLNDPDGSTTGNASDIPAGHGSGNLDDLKRSIGHGLVSVDVTWTLLAGFLVMFMQTGFALLETGFCRAKNASHTMAMNIGVYALGLLGYWCCGYALQMGGVAVPGAPLLLGGTPGLNHEVCLTIFGKSFGLFGAKGFFLSWGAYDVSIFTLFLFQLVFMDTAATIPTGAMAERWKFASFVVYAFFMSMLVYPLFANWVWGGGWLSQLGHNFHLGHGHVDFAGSSVVHMTGGVAALAGASVLGARIGKYTKDGEPIGIPGHHIPMAVAGTLILAFGWFGFNAGSTLAGTNLRIGVIAANTMMASGAGASAAMFWVWKRIGKPDTSMIANGLLAGLVAITAPCAFVNSPCAVLIGLIAGILVVESVFFVERRLKVDDPVGAISVHGVCGAWGALSVGLFADGSYPLKGLNGVDGPVRGLFYGDPTQLAAQMVGVATCFVFVGVSFLLFFKLLNEIMGIRVSRRTELAGLDVPEMGGLAYPDFAVFYDSTDDAS